MCECGCTANDDRCTLPGPGKSFYIVSLSGGCDDCDAPAGITIELIEPSNTLYKDYKRGDFVDGPLRLEQWPDSKGVCIITGHRRCEFVKAAKSHLVGLDSRDFGDGAVIDDDGAGVILEEMHADASVKPFVVKPVKRK